MVLPQATAFLTLVQSLLPDRYGLATGAFANPSAVLSTARRQGGFDFFYYGQLPDGLPCQISFE